MTTVAELAIKEFEEKNVNWHCLYPAILIRVLPKNMISQGGIILTEEANTKPLYEAIVLRVYPPKTIKVNGKWILMESGVQPGDHILFPHWSGESVPGLSEEFASTTGLKNDEYRLIPSYGAVSMAGNKEAGEPCLIINYEKESVRQKLYTLIEEVYNHGRAKGYSTIEDLENENPYFNRKIEEIIRDFDILVKVKGSLIRQ